MIDIEQAIEDRRTQIARLRALRKELAVLIREANRVSGATMTDEQLKSRWSDAQQEMKALGLTGATETLWRLKVA